jgi:hypothetical protein
MELGVHSSKKYFSLINNFQFFPNAKLNDHFMSTVIVYLLSETGDKL